MSIEQLAETAQAMVAPGKGIIAIDESTSTIAKRFASVGIENIEENRRAYRELLLTTPKLSDYISGAILFDETIRQKTKDGVPFAEYMTAHGIIPGIKVDKGAQPLAGMPGELVTEGLDGCAHVWRSTTRWARVSPSGVRSSTSAKTSRPAPASRPIRMRWRVTPRCARNRAWCRWSSRK